MSGSLSVARKFLSSSIFQLGVTGKSGCGSLRQYAHRRLQSLEVIMNQFILPSNKKMICHIKIQLCVTKRKERKEKRTLSMSEIYRALPLLKFLNCAETCFFEL